MTLRRGSDYVPLRLSEKVRGFLSSCCGDNMGRIEYLTCAVKGSRQLELDRPSLVLNRQGTLLAYFLDRNSGELDIDLTITG